MNLQSRLWYVRWFFWCCRVLDNFMNTKPTHYRRQVKYANGTNLCHFFRILMWGNLLFVLTLAAYGYVFFTVFILPLILFKFVSVGIVVLLCCIGAGAFVLLVFLIWRLGKAIGTWQANYALAHPKKPSDPTRPRFWRVMAGYYRAIKEKICPIIRFEDTP